MNILIIGSGGREHAFADKIVQSKRCDKLFVAPGNAGTAGIALNLNIDILDFEAVKQAVLAHQIDMVVVGPEAPLVAGITDYFAADQDLKNVIDRKSTRLNSSHVRISYAVFCLKKKTI